MAPQGRDHWDKMGMRRALEALRSEAGEAMVLRNNYFIEEILPNAILRKLSDEEMEIWTASLPFLSAPNILHLNGRPRTRGRSLLLKAARACCWCVVRFSGFAATPSSAIAFLRAA